MFFAFLSSVCSMSFADTSICVAVSSIRQSATDRNSISLGVLPYIRPIAAASLNKSRLAARKGLQILAVCQDLASQVPQNKIRVLSRKPVRIELCCAWLQGGLRFNEGLIEHLPVFANK